MTTIIGYVVGAGIIAILTAAGAGFVWYYDSVYSAGKKSAKLNQEEKELADERRASEIIAEPLTPGDTAKNLNDGTF